MNQMRIGKFIQELRKEKKLTQKELADKIGVIDKTVSKWENGRGLPDVSILRKLSEVLDVSVNELLSAEKIPLQEKEIKVEENYYNVVDSKTKLQSDITGNLIFKIIGLILLFIGLGYFNIEGFWVNLFIITGSIFIIIGSYKLVKSSKIIPRILYVLIISIILFVVINYFEYLKISNVDIATPRFYYKKVIKDNCTLYKKLTFSCITINNDKLDRKHCDIYEKDYSGKYHIFLEEYDKVEDALNSKYCKPDYDPYEDGLYNNLE